MLFKICTRFWYKKLKVDSAWQCKAAFTRQIFVGQHVLANSKKLANSCVHTSNTRQIATMASMVQWHTRRVATSGLLLFYVFRRRNNKKRWRNRKVWVKSYIKSYISTPHLPFFSVCLPHLYIHWTKFPTNPGMTESHQ